MKTMLDEYPSLDRLERMFAGIRAEMAEFRGEMQVEAAKFREEIRKELSNFKLRVTWLLVASLVAIVVNLGLTIWKH